MFKYGIELQGCIKVYGLKKVLIKLFSKRRVVVDKNLKVDFFDFFSDFFLFFSCL